MVDAHAKALTRDELDGKRLGAGGQPNNAWWNGLADPAVR
jgi:hypothetical protein